MGLGVWGGSNGSGGMRWGSGVVLMGLGDALGVWGGYNGSGGLGVSGLL